MATTKNRSSQEGKEQFNTLLLYYPNLYIDINKDIPIEDKKDKFKIMAIVDNVPNYVKVYEILNYLYESGTINEYEYYCAHADKTVIYEKDDKYLYQILLNMYKKNIVKYDDLLLSSVVRTYNMDMIYYDDWADFTQEPFVYINTIDKNLFNVDLFWDNLSCSKEFYNDVYRYISKIYQIAIRENRPAYLFRIISKIQELNVNVKVLEENSSIEKKYKNKDLNFVCALELERDGNKIYISLLNKNEKVYKGSKTLKTI